MTSVGAGACPAEAGEGGANNGLHRLQSLKWGTMTERRTLPSAMTRCSASGLRCHILFPYSLREAAESCQSGVGGHGEEQRGLVMMDYVPLGVSRTPKTPQRTLLLLLLPGRILLQTPPGVS